MTAPETGAVRQFSPPPPVPVTVAVDAVPDTGGVVGAGAGLVEDVETVAYVADTQPSIPTQRTGSQPLLT
ncbi:MAG TPA: hypothetical protein VGR29_12585, partial [Thermomicrobiales bacterium]|nr:hypothetical protein [Thermomicrobiales bacterium]